MRRFLTIVVACVIGLGIAFFFRLVAGLIRPCSGEQLSCSITSLLGLIYAPVFGATALVALSVATYWKGSMRALDIAMLVPLLPFLLFFTYVKWSQFAVREFHETREHDIQEVLLIAIPIVLTLVVPWAVLRWQAAPKPD